MLNSIVSVLDSGGAGGGGGAYESIATATGTGSSGTITFSSIPSTYASLQIRFALIDTVGVETLAVRLNGDTASNYSAHYLAGNGSAASAGSSLTTRMNVLGIVVGTKTTYANVGILDLHDYASTTKYKTIRTFAGVDANGSGELDLTSGSWRSTSAVNSVTLYLGGTNNFGTSSVFSLYGIKGA